MILIALVYLCQSRIIYFISLYNNINVKYTKFFKNILYNMLEKFIFKKNFFLSKYYIHDFLLNILLNVLNV